MIYKESLDIILEKIEECLEGVKETLLADGGDDNVEADAEKITSIVEEVKSAIKQKIEALKGTLEDKPIDLGVLSDIATALDVSGDEKLQKKAAAIDEILYAIARNPNLIANGSTTADELNKLREQYRGIPKRNNPDEKKITAMRDAVDKRIKRYRPMEAPLSTRYSPDIAGNMLTRIADNVYQDVMTGKIYNHSAGFTTSKGNEVPGYGVENQLPNSEQAYFNAPFTTREDKLGEKT